MRKIKFRAWDKNRSESGMMLVNHTFQSIGITGLYNDDSLIWMEFTGLQDKHGVDIFAGDVLRINITNDNYPLYDFDGLYKVNICFRGVSFQFINLAWEDGGKNQYPITTRIESQNIHNRWHDKEGCHYTEMSDGKEVKSKSIEVIGNIHENPELLR